MNILFKGLVWVLVFSLLTSARSSEDIDTVIEAVSKRELRLNSGTATVVRKSFYEGKLNQETSSLWAFSGNNLRKESDDSIDLEGTDKDLLQDLQQIHTGTWISDGKTETVYSVHPDPFKIDTVATHTKPLLFHDITPLTCSFRIFEEKVSDYLKRCKLESKILANNNDFVYLFGKDDQGKDVEFKIDVTKDYAPSTITIHNPKSGQTREFKITEDYLDENIWLPQTIEYRSYRTKPNGDTYDESRITTKIIFSNLNLDLDKLFIRPELIKGTTEIDVISGKRYSIGENGERIPISDTSKDEKKGHSSLLTWLSAIAASVVIIVVSIRYIVAKPS